MPARKLSDFDVAAIRAWAATRMTRREVAIKYGVSVETVAKLISDSSYRPPMVEVDRVTDAEFQMLVRCESG